MRREAKSHLFAFRRRLPIFHARAFEPDRERPHRAALRMRAVGNAHRLAGPFLVSLRFRDGDDEAVVGEPHVLVTEGHQLAAPQRPGEAHQQQRPVAGNA